MGQLRLLPPLAALDVVVVNYQQLELTLACLDSLEVAGRAVGWPVHVHVVDNASTSASAEALARRHPATRITALDENIGFPAAVTIGLAGGTADWVLLLNNDATVHPDALVALARSVDAAPTDVGAIAALMRFAHQPDLVNSAGIDVDALGVARDLCLGEPVDGTASVAREVFGASAGAAVYRRSALAAIGGFDGSFFVYLEDVDVAWRARMAGWRTLYDPAIVVDHHHAATAGHGSPFKNFHVGRNRMRLLAKDMDRGTLARHFPALLAYEVAYCAYVAARSRDLSPVRGRLRGLREWRTYRAAGARLRRPLALTPPLGARAALRRRAAWPDARAPSA